MTRRPITPRRTVVIVALTVAFCIAWTVGSYHYGFLQGTRDTIKNTSMVPQIPEKFAPLPTSEPVQIEWHFEPVQSTKKPAAQLELIEGVQTRLFIFADF